MKKIGVVLSGCGVYDGSEIHETVLTLLALSRQGADVICFAPDIHPLTQADAAELDAIIVPGGFGAAKNLSTFATEGAACHVDPDLKALSLAMHAAGKPQGFICIAPAMLPKIFDFPLRLTIGTDIDTAEIVEDMGGEHVPCPVDDIVVDEDNKIITTPAYMLAQNIAEAAAGIEKLVDRVLVLAE